MEGSRWALKVGNQRLRLSLQSLPDEIWTLVFETFDSPSDLFQVVQTCKFLYSLAIRVLYRDLNWTGPFRYASNVQFWNRQAPSMDLAPTSLTVTISLVNSNAFTRYDPAVGIVEEDGSWTGTPESIATQIIYALDEVPESKKVSFFASHRMYTAITKRISTFASLHDLVFHLCELPDTVFPAIKLLPHLRHLSFQYCTLPALDLEPDLSFSELPITELTLWFLKGEPETVPKSNYIYTMYLCSARNLRTLRIDWCPVTGRFLSQSIPDVAIAPLTGLTDLTLRFPMLKSWTGEDLAYAAGECLEEFLVGSPNIQHFSCVNKRARFRLSDTVLSNLTSYSGSMLPGVSLLESRPTIEHIEMTDTDKKCDEIIAMLEKIAFHAPCLKTLRFRMYRWDKEIMYVLVSLFADLGCLGIRFENGSLSSQLLLSLGSLFLHHFPGLETLEIFRTSGTNFAAMNTTPGEPVVLQDTKPEAETSKAPPEPTAADNDSYVQESLNAWRKSCPLLRKVRLTKAAVWRRAFDGDQWCKRDVPTPLNKRYELY